jgi:hypothetical protein
MIVEDELDRRMARIVGVEELEELDEFGSCRARKVGALGIGRPMSSRSLPDLVGNSKLMICSADSATR